MTQGKWKAAIQNPTSMNSPNSPELDTQQRMLQENGLAGRARRAQCPATYHYAPLYRNVCTWNAKVCRRAAHHPEPRMNGV